jgi:hypothetical protein
MAIDQSKLGNHIQEQMEAIEGDSGVPEDAEIRSIITIVEVVAPAQEVRNMRVRSNVQPHVGIGLLEEAKMIQLGMLSGGGQ